MKWLVTYEVYHITCAGEVETKYTEIVESSIDTSVERWYYKKVEEERRRRNGKVAILFVFQL